MRQREASACNELHGNADCFMSKSGTLLLMFHDFEGSAMRRYLLFAVLLFSSPALFAQWDVSGNVGISLNRIYQAFDSGSPNSISDMFASPVTIRLGDSLYMDIAGMQASTLLNKFFADKQVISFDTGLPGDGSLRYAEGGTRHTLRVDVFLQRAIGGPEIRALNISNYPMANMFFNLHKHDQALSSEPNKQGRPG